MLRSKLSDWAGSRILIDRRSLQTEASLCRELSIYWVPRINTQINAGVCANSTAYPGHTGKQRGRNGNGRNAVGWVALEPASFIPEILAFWGNGLNFNKTIGSVSLLKKRHKAKSFLRSCHKHVGCASWSEMESGLKVSTLPNHGWSPPVVQKRMQKACPFFSMIPIFAVQHLMGRTNSSWNKSSSASIPKTVTSWSVSWVTMTTKRHISQILKHRFICYSLRTA